jgi:hypothetical protein
MKNKVDVNKRMREIMFITEHHLCEDRFKKLIQDKLERVEHYQKALEKREQLCNKESKYL